MNDYFDFSVNRIVKTILDKTSFKADDTPLIRNQNTKTEYYIGKPHERDSQTGSNLMRDWVQQSKRWKDFPKRENSLTFTYNYSNNYFGEYEIQIIPYDDTKIAYSSNGDFNYSFINEHISNIVENNYYIGSNISWGKGYPPNKILKILLFGKYENKTNLNSNIKKICNVRELELENKTTESIILKEYKKHLNTLWNNYYDFIDYIMSPEINGFSYFYYKDLKNYIPGLYNELWIDSNYISMNNHYGYYVKKELKKKE